MSYSRINYSDFKPFRIEKIAGRGVKKISWDKIVSQKEIDSFVPHQPVKKPEIHRPIKWNI